MKIALLGTRGVPAHYGGFETCAEEIASSLVKNGHTVTVYCRVGNADGNPPDYKGIRLIYKPCLNRKSLGTLSHTFLCMLHACRQDYDILMVFNAANSPIVFFSKLVNSLPIAINVDGLEWKRRKWGIVGKTYYQFAEWLSSKVADRIVSDSRGIQDYYKKRWKVSSTFIAYGAHLGEFRSHEILQLYGLEDNEYFFTASRLEPENNADITIKAFQKLCTNKKLVIAGGANWKSPFIKTLEEEARKDSRIKLLGPIYTPGHIEALHTHCFAYVHGNEVGGTNPALLKAMGYGNCVLAFSDQSSRFNSEVLGNTALFYNREPEVLQACMQQLLDKPKLAKELGKRAIERIRKYYTWKRIAEDYEKLFERLVANYYKTHPQSD